VVCEVLDTIIADEARHAALAWRTLAWLLSDDADGFLRRRLAARLDAEERARRPLPASPSVAALGLPPVRARQEAARRGWEHVVRKAFAQLAA